jgi:hypothetical protein
MIEGQRRISNISIAITLYGAINLGHYFADQWQCWRYNVYRPERREKQTEVSSTYRPSASVA